MRANVARACGEFGVARVGPILIAALDDRDWPVRAALCESIGLLRADGGARAMAGLLTDPEESVREAGFHTSGLPNNEQAKQEQYENRERPSPRKKLQRSFRLLK